MSVQNIASCVERAPDNIRRFFPVVPNGPNQIRLVFDVPIYRGNVLRSSVEITETFFRLGIVKSYPYILSRDTYLEHWLELPPKKILQHLSELVREVS